MKNQKLIAELKKNDFVNVTAQMDKIVGGRMAEANFGCTVNEGCNSGCKPKEEACLNKKDDSFSFEEANNFSIV